MNILLISGSPHRNGTTSVMVEAFMQGAAKAGHHVDWFNAGVKEVHPCIACEHCHGATSSCVFRDDFDEIAEKVIDADAVVFASPIFYYGMTAQIKAVIDRFYAINNDIKKYKKTALMLAFGDSLMESADGAIASFYGMTDYLGWEIEDVIAAKGCFTAEDIEKTQYPQRAYSLGEKILGNVVETEPVQTGAKSLNDLVAALANFSSLAEEVIKETEDNEVFVGRYQD